MFAFLVSCDFEENFVEIFLYTLVRLMLNKIKNCLLNRRFGYLIKISSKKSTDKSKRNFEIINKLIVHKKCKQTKRNIVPFKDEINDTNNKIYYML